MFCRGHAGEPVVFLYCNYLMVWVLAVLMVALTEHIVLDESCVWLFSVCFSWGVFMKLTDVFLKRTIISFQIQYFSLLVFPEWAWFCCCFLWSMRVKRVPLKSLWPVWTPLLYVVFFSVQYVSNFVNMLRCIVLITTVLSTLFAHNKKIYINY